MTSEFEKGRLLCERLHGKHSGADLITMLKEVCPDYLVMNMEWAYAGITARPVLSIEIRVLLLLGCCICRGELPAQVRAYTEAALGLGLSKSEITETILQTLPIAGFPAVTNAMLAVQDVLTSEVAT